MQIVERSRLADTCHAFSVTDEATGETLYYLPCYRCGKRIEVTHKEFMAANYCTCCSCLPDKREARK